MDLTKDIYLSKDKIYEDSTLDIRYSGKLTKNNQGNIYLTYGYGDLWENKSEIQMAYTTSGYLATINISNGDNLQFCFKDSNNNWDNNNSKNYIVEINKLENLLDFGPIENNLEDDQSNTDESSDDILEESVVSSDTIELFDTQKLAETNTIVIPANTLIKQITMDEEPKIVEKIIESKQEASSTPESFVDITNNAKQKSVKAFDDGNVTAGSVYVNSLIDDYQPKYTEPPQFIEEITINSLVPVNDKKALSKNLSSFYFFKKRVKLGFLKFIKLIKTALNYDENNI